MCMPRDKQGVVDVCGVLVVVPLYHPPVLVVLVAKSCNEGDDGLNKAVGGEEVP